MRWLGQRNEDDIDPHDLVTAIQWNALVSVPLISATWIRDGYINLDVEPRSKYNLPCFSHYFATLVHYDHLFNHHVS